MMTLGQYLAGLRRHDVAHSLLAESPEQCVQAAPHGLVAERLAGDAAAAQAERAALQAFASEALAAMGEHADYTTSWWEACEMPLAAPDDPLAQLASLTRHDHLEVALCSFGPHDYHALLAMPLSEAMQYLSLRALGGKLAQRQSKTT